MLNLAMILGPKAAPPLMANGTGHGTGFEVIVKLVPMSTTSDHDAMVEAEAVTLVHCKLLKSEEQRENFKNLKMSPVYWREFRVRKSEARGHLSPCGPCVNHPLQSTWHSHLMSLTMTFTSTMEGKYQIYTSMYFFATLFVLIHYRLTDDLESKISGFLWQIFENFYHMI